MNELAVDLWKHHGQQVPEVVEALEALFDEMAHVELTPFEPLIDLIKNRLIDAAARSAVQEGADFDSAPDR